MTMKTNEPNLSRRSILLKMAALGSISALSGCCTPSCRLDTSSIGRKALPQDDVGLPFAVFDVHSHIFNGRDIQGGRYLRGPIANDLDRDHPEVANGGRSIADFAQDFSVTIAPSLQDDNLAIGL